MTKQSRQRSFSERVKRFVAIAASAGLVGGGAAGIVLGTAARATADTQGPITFESGYATGSVNGQNGWTSSGPYDQAIVDNSSIVGAPSSFGTKSLRISDAVTSDSFGDQTFSPGTVNAAGEPTADAGVFPTGTLQNHFSASFAFASVTPGVEQPGLHMSISPDRGDGTRMSYVRIEDSASGWNLFFDDYQDVAPLGSDGNLNDGCSTGDGFTDIPIASAVDSSVPHTLTFNMNLIPGPHNDVVSVLLDGHVIHTGTSWEDYYRYCAESGGGTGGTLPDQSRIVRNLLFREAGSGDADPANIGKGFLLDGVTETSALDCTTTCFVNGTTGDDANTGLAGSPLKTVQAGVNLVQPGGTVMVAAGTYPEQVVANKAVTITGAGQAMTTIQGPASMADSTCVTGARAVVSICGSSGSTVVMSGVTISGGVNGEDASNSCSTQITGAYVSDGETLDLSQSTVTNTYNAAGSGTWGCQQGTGIRAGSSGLGFTGNLIADHVTVLRYQKAGIVVDGSGSTTAITNSQVEGDQLAGLSTFIAMNGIQIGRGASGSVAGTTVSGNECDNTGAGCGPDPLANQQSLGILLFDSAGQSPVPTVSLTNNTLTGNDAGIYSSQLTGTSTISGNTVNANRYLGVFLDEGTATLTANHITNNGSVPDGVGVIAVQGEEGVADTTATLSGNTISGNPTGVKVDDVTPDAFTTHVTVMRNALTANPTQGITNDAAQTVNGTCNWWGQATGPAAGQASAGVTTTPFLRLSTLTAACPATKPSAPRPASAVPFGSGTAKVIWNAPVTNGGAAITGYTVTPYLAGVAQPAHVFSSTALTEMIAGLVNGKSYKFAIQARNAVGTSVMSPQTPAMIAGAPGQPGVPTVTFVVAGSLKVTFTAPMNDGAAITSDTATCTSSNGGATKSKAGTASPITVTGLTHPKSYTCTVTSTNSRGAGPASSPSAAKNA